MIKVPLHVTEWITYPNEALQLLIVLQQLLVEADALVVMAAENTVPVPHIFSQLT